MLTSPSKFLTGTIFIHAHLQAVYYNCVKFHLNPMSRLGGVVLTSPSLHTERISEYKLNYLPSQLLDSDHISSCTSAGSVLQLCKVSQKSNKPFRRSCALQGTRPPFSWKYKLNYLAFQILDSNHIPSCTSAGSVLQMCKVS
jgi:hypothetical protein